MAKAGCQTLGADPYRGWPIWSLIGNAGTAAGLILTLWLLTRSFRLGLLAAGAFLIAPWTTQYLFFGLYAPLLAALGTAVCAGLIYSVWVARTELQAGLGLAGTGLLGALLHLVAPSAFFFMVLILGSAFLLHRKRLALAFILPAVYFGLLFPFNLFNGHVYLVQLSNNLNCQQPADTAAKLGAVPAPPFFTLGHILGAFEPGTLAALGLLAVLGAFGWGRARSGEGETDNTGAAAQWLLGLVLAHAVIIDLLPFTKLARGQFVVFPALILGLALLGRQLWLRCNRRTWLAAGLLILAGLHLGESGRFLYRIREARLGAINAGLFQPGRLRLWAQDPRAPMLAAWLKCYAPRLVDDLSQMQAGEVLLLGPQGPGSGMCIAKPKKPLNESGLEMDFSFDLSQLQSRAVKITRLPFYAYFPSFQLEHELGQALYWHGDIPDYRQERLQLSACQF